VPIQDNRSQPHVNIYLRRGFERNDMVPGNAADRAVAYFKNGHCCSQAVFATWAPELGMDRETALKIASPFCGGMGRLGKTCGAVTGAFLAIGLAHGSSEPDSQARENAYHLVNEFVERFTARNGSIECRDLIGCDIGTPEGYRRATEENLFETVCEKLVRDATEIAGELLRGDAT
jgi:C_GCAxxG_C_C family probable redox protein